MPTMRFVVSIILAELMFFCSGVVCGQTTSTSSGQAYPNKSIRIVTFGVGGTNDLIARMIAQDLMGPFGQPIVVDNRPAKVVPGQVVSKAQPDGYTLLVAGSSFWVGPLLQETPYDPVKDFSPITIMSRAPAILVVHPALPVKSVKELIALAKAKPGALNYASSGVGGAAHLSVELFKSMAGVNIVHIPYKGSGPQMTALLGGESQMMFESPSVVLPPAKLGKLTALAVSSSQPTPLAPGLATVAASLPGYEAVSMIALFAPAKTPAVVINRLNQETGRFLKSAETKERFFNSGLEAVGGPPEQLATAIKSEMGRMGKVIKDAGITAD